MTAMATMVPKLLGDLVVKAKVVQVAVQAHRAAEMARLEVEGAPTMGDLEVDPTAGVVAHLDKEAAPAMGVPLELMTTLQMAVFRVPALALETMMETVHQATEDPQGQTMAITLATADHQALVDLIPPEAVAREEPKAELKVVLTMRMARVAVVHDLLALLQAPRALLVVVLEGTMDQHREILSLKAVAQRAARILAMEALVVLDRLLAVKAPAEMETVTLDQEETMLEEEQMVVRVSHLHREEEVILAAQAVEHQSFEHRLRPTLSHPAALYSPLPLMSSRLSPMLNLRGLVDQPAAAVSQLGSKG